MRERERTGKIIIALSTTVEKNERIQERINLYVKPKRRRRRRKNEKKKCL